MDHRIIHRIEEFLLFLLIVVQVFDFLEILPGDLDYIKKLVSWAAIGYLFYKASISRILFGTKKRHLDLAIITAYFLFIIKDLVAVAIATRHEAAFFKTIIELIFNNQSNLIIYSVYLGSLITAIASIYVTLKLPIKAPSFLAATHEEGLPYTIPQKLFRFTSTLFVLFGFFVIIFNLITEWLAIALDAPLVVIAIFVYLFLIVGRHKHFSADHLIFKIGEFGEEFYTKFIELFHSKKTIYLGITGMLALHLLTEVGNFLLPYLLSIKDSFYFEHLTAGSHIPLTFLYIKEIVQVSGINTITLSIAYIFNYLAILFLLIAPAFVWYKMFKRSQFHFGRLTQSILASLFCFITLPMLRLSAIKNSILVGVDIQTHNLLETGLWIDKIIPNRLAAIGTIVLISLIIGLIFYFFEFNSEHKKKIFISLISAGMIFFGMYIYYFFISQAAYFIATLSQLFLAKQFILLLFIVSIAIITLTFYFFGFIFFIFESAKHYREVLA